MAKDSKNLPPYVSFGIFKSTIEQLAESTVPTGPLDRRVIDGISGADHGALMSGLRFLGLVDEQRNATSEYRALVEVSKDATKFHDVLRQLIATKYQPIIGNVDLRAGTSAQVEKAFRDFGVAQGQMLTKSIRFLIKALQECKFAVSPHITKPKPKTARTNGGRPATDNARTRAKSTASPNPPAESNTEAPRGFDRMPLPGVAGAFIQYPADLTSAHCDLLDTVIAVLRAYAKGRSGGKEKKP